MGGALQAAEALNTLGVMDLKAGSLGDARAALTGALELGARSLALRARVEQNLGILANIQGELEEAIARYGASLDAYRRAEDLHRSEEHTSELQSRLHLVCRLLLSK